MTDHFDPTDFWEDSDYARQAYVEEPITDELVRSIEAELGFRLPSAYVALMRQQNGGIPKRTCHPTDLPTSWAEDHVAITGFFGIGRHKPHSLLGPLGGRFMQREWGYPDFGLCICDCPSAGHDMVMLDYRASGPEGEPAVVHVDQECDFRVTPLAPTLDAFVRGLVPASHYDTSADDLEEAPTRLREGSFSTRLSQCIADSPDPPRVEASLRQLLASIAREKGYFALHGDPSSHLVYDAVFHLYASSPCTSEPLRFREDWGDLLAFGDGQISTGGYAPNFLDTWWKTRVRTGAIERVGGRLALTGEIREKALAALGLA